MHNQVRRDFLIQQTFKKDFEKAIEYINFEVSDCQKENLLKTNFELEILKTVKDNYFKTPEIKFDEKVSSSTDEYTVNVEVTVKNNIGFFQKIFDIAMHDKNFDNSIVTKFSQKQKNGEGTIVFVGKSDLKLADYPEMITRFKKSVEKNVSIFEEYLLLFSTEYEKLEHSELNKFTKSVLIARSEKLKNIQTNKDLLGDW